MMIEIHNELAWALHVLVRTPSLKTHFRGIGINRKTYICSLIFLKSSKSCKATERPSAIRLQLSAPPPMNLKGNRSISRSITSHLNKAIWRLSLDHSLDAVDPRDKLKSRACWRVTLDIWLRSTVHRIEHHKTILRPSILEGQDTQGSININSSKKLFSKQVSYGITGGGIHEKTLTSPPKSVSAGGPPLKYLW